MAMSQGERMARLLEQQGRYRSRQQTTSSWHHTREIVQPRASGTVFPETRTPTNYAIQGTVVRQGSEVPGGLDSSITKNVYSANGAPIGCCATYVTSGTETYDEQNALIQKAQSCAVCAPVNSYWLYNGYAIDMSGTLVKGGWTCPIPNLVNTAKTTAAERCASCKKFYFPNPAQPSICAGCAVPYPNNRYYPPPPIDWELRRYGDDRVPQQGRNGCPSNTPTMGDLVLASAAGIQPIVLTYTYTGEGILVSGQVTGSELTTYDVALPLTPGTITFNKICVATTSNVTITVTIQNDCGSVTKSIVIQNVIPIC